MSLKELLHISAHLTPSAKQSRRGHDSSRQHHSASTSKLEMEPKDTKKPKILFSIHRNSGLISGGHNERILLPTKRENIYDVGVKSFQSTKKAAANKFFITQNLSRLKSKRALVLQHSADGLSFMTPKKNSQGVSDANLAASSQKKSRRVTLKDCFLATTISAGKPKPPDADIVKTRYKRIKFDLGRSGVSKVNVDHSSSTPETKKERQIKVDGSIDQQQPEGLKKLFNDNDKEVKFTPSLGKEPGSVNISPSFKFYVGSFKFSEFKSMPEKDFKQEFLRRSIIKISYKIFALLRGGFTKRDV